jgi:hypothetical protein
LRQHGERDGAGLERGGQASLPDTGGDASKLFVVQQDSQLRALKTSIAVNALFGSITSAEEYFDLQRYSGAIQAFFRETGMIFNERV